LRFFLETQVIDQKSIKYLQLLLFEKALVKMRKIRDNMRDLKSRMSEEQISDYFNNLPTKIIGQQHIKKGLEDLFENNSVNLPFQDEFSQAVANLELEENNNKYSFMVFAAGKFDEVLQMIENETEELLLKYPS
jgi:hypothetical protein